MSGGSPMHDAIAWRCGVELAIQMIEDTHGLHDEMVLPNDCREGRPQYNGILIYLRRLRDYSDARVEAAFASVLSEYISSSEEGGALSTADMARLARRPVPFTTERPSIELDRKPHQSEASG